jgi:hypothetical protein
MIIALDYDHTFTEDPEGWLEAMKIMRMRGHLIYGVTMRYDTETAGMSERYLAACDKIFFTGRCAKQPFMAARGIQVQVWIDDMPQWVLNDAR